MRAPRCFLLPLLLAAIGCGDDGSPEPAGSPPPGSAQGALTFWDDVGPILNAKCVACHQPGGIGPFALDRFEVADTHAALIATKTRTGVMPPYLVAHDGSCGEFEDAETLTAAELETLQRWAKGPRVEGTPRSSTRPVRPGIDDGIPYTTPTLVPVAQWGTRNEMCIAILMLALPSQ